VQDLSIADLFECWCWYLDCCIDYSCCLIKCSIETSLGLLFLLLRSFWCHGTGDI
jgi:hypothetical protein